MGLFRRRAGSPDGPLLSAGLQEKDLSVLDALRDSGARLDEPRHVLHYLYFPSQRAAEQAAATAKSQGWEAGT